MGLFLYSSWVRKKIRLKKMRALRRTNNKRTPDTNKNPGFYGILFLQQNTKKNPEKLFVPKKFDVNFLYVNEIQSLNEIRNDSTGWTRGFLPHRKMRISTEQKP
uniref:Uncharacterized protein n=1 Tax=Cacopsylla melanoneura TaxID=428564 RepID=A0A8D8YYW7_9HEMI